MPYFNKEVYAWGVPPEELEERWSSLPPEWQETLFLFHAKDADHEKYRDVAGKSLKHLSEGWSTETLQSLVTALSRDWKLVLDAIKAAA